MTQFGRETAPEPTEPPPSDAAAERAVIVLSRFSVPQDAADGFVVQAEAAIAVLRTKAGLVSLDFGHNLDDRDLWTITTRWRDIGSYRRALSGIESKMVVVPLLSRAIDEPSAYDDPDQLDPIFYRGEAPPPTQ